MGQCGMPGIFSILQVRDQRAYCASEVVRLGVFFFLSLYAFPPKGALGYEAGQIGLVLHGRIAMLDSQNEHYACYYTGFLHQVA